MRAFAECTQQAAAYVAARSRGDLDAAETLMASFDNEAQRTLAFASLAELAVRLLAMYDETPIDVTASNLAVAVAGAAPERHG